MRLIDAENLKYEKVLSANGNGVYRETNILYESQIDTIKTVEAIPIEWVKKFIDNDILSETVKILLNAWYWEKENE